MFVKRFGNSELTIIEGEYWNAVHLMNNYQLNLSTRCDFFASLSIRIAIMHRIDQYIRVA